MTIFSAPDKYGYPEFYRDAFYDLLKLQEVKKGAKKFLVAPVLDIDSSDCVTLSNPKLLFDRLYDSPLLLDRLRTELGIQKGIAIEAGDNYDTLMEMAKQVALRRASIRLANKEGVIIPRKDKPTKKTIDDNDEQE